MKRSLFKACVPLGTLLLLSGCIDNDYDLSDIDKTTQINVNDLVIPVNIDAIELSDIIEIKDDSKIKIVDYNGQSIYAVTQSGEFNSDPIEIKGFTAKAPSVDLAKATFDIIPARAASMQSTYELTDFTPYVIEIKANDVDKSIKDITSVECEPLDISMKLTATGFGSETTLKLDRIRVNFIKGLTLQNLPTNYSYDSATGLLVINDLPCPDHQAEIKFTATGVNFRESGTTLVDGTFNFSSTVTIDDARLEMTMNTADPSALPTRVEFAVATIIGELTPISFSGVIEYSLTGNSLNIDPVNLNDIPSFLDDKGTNLRLVNPQIYLGTNNPMAPYGMTVQTGLELTSVRGNDRQTFSLDPGQVVNVGDSYGVDGPYNFVLSPSMPEDPLDAYAANLQHVGFAGLSDVLAGDGLPRTIEIKLDNPEVPRQTVENFRLFTTIPSVKGSYYFFAPLALATGENGSVIVYSDTKDDWSDEDLDKLTIKELTVEADAYSTLPIGAELSIYPLDKTGNKMAGVTVTPATIRANADGQKITVSVKGEIKELDGVTYEAVVRPGSEETLSPEQSLRLSNIKAKVTGYYLTDF